MNATIDIPVEHIIALLATHAYAPGCNREPDLVAVLQAAATQPLPAGDTPGTIRIDAETAWWLAYTSPAAVAFNLDEESTATYRHPAIVAENTIMELIYAQLPEVYAHCEEHV